MRLQSMMGLSCALGVSAVVAFAASAEDALVHAVVDGDQVIACRLADGTEVSSEQCPTGTALAQAVIPPTAGELMLLIGPRSIKLISDEYPDDPCGDQRSAAATTSKPKPLGRASSEIATTSQQYRKLVGEALGIADVQLTHLIKLDLDGDGVDEVVFAANSHPGGQPMSGEFQTYSSVGVRKVRTTDGQTVVDTIEITGHRGSVNWNEGFPDITQVFLKGFADLNGDGKLEIVVRIDGYESHFIGVYRLNGKEAEMLGSTGCAI